MPDLAPDLPTRSENPTTSPLRLATTVLTVGLGALAVYAVWLSRGFGFIVDEWDILAHHVHGEVLTPYNGHLSLVPIVIYQGLAHTVGIGSYRLYGLVGLACFVAIPAAFFVTHRRRVDPLLVACASLAIAWSWGAEGNILYGFLLNFDIPIVALIVAWPLIRRGDLRGDLWAVAAMTVALATSSVGVVVAFALGIELLIRRVPFRRLLRFAPPVALWVVWWLVRHDPTKPASLVDKASYAWHMVVAILAGFTLGWKPGAALTAVALVVLVGIAWRRWHTLDAHVLAIGAALVFFVVLSTWSRTGDIALNPPDSPRYVWVGDVLLIAAAVWCVRGRRVPLPALGAAAAVTLLGAVALVGHLGDYRTYVLDYGDRVRPFLVGAEAAGPAADPDRILPLNLIPVTVGQYLDLVEAVGSPVTGVGFDRLGSAASRLAADRTLVAETVRARAVAGRPACRSGWRPLTLRGPVTLTPGDALFVDADRGVEVGLRRLSTAFPPTPDVRIPDDASWIVSTRPGDPALPWHVDLGGSVRSAAVCAR